MSNEKVTISDHEARTAISHGKTGNHGDIAVVLAYALENEQAVVGAVRTALIDFVHAPSVTGKAGRDQIMDLVRVISAAVLRSE